MCERYAVASRVAELIVKRRDELKLTDAALARRLKVTPSQVHDWVHGEHEPTLASLRRIAKGLGLDLSDLLDA